MSPVKDVRDQYQHAINFLRPFVDNFHNDMNWIRNRTDIGSYRGSTAGDGSTGKVVSDFESALDRHERSLGELVGVGGVFGQAFVELEGKWNLLISRKRLLDTMSEEEDAGAVYTYADIPF